MLTQHAVLFSHGSTVIFSESYPALAEYVLLSSHLFYCCQWDLEALRKGSADVFKTLKERLKCMTVLLAFTDWYRCLCPSQSSPTLGTTACWCTGLLSEPPPPGTLCSATGETVWHSSQGMKAQFLQDASAHLDESVYFHLSAFRQSFDLHLADGAHVEVVHRWASTKPMSTRT